MTTAQKWGGSIGVRIPQKIAKKYGVVSGSPIQVSDDGEKIIIQPVENEFTLEELLEQCEGDNPHEELFSDSSGKEEL
ncbi:AbrB/MazE/SpoVT family DNA-binding domain-containing protein [Barrientosiimonas marina]|uniref:AbrB/MazE/SpoVT family DNA-binding domain-containing protein n=1 Tax=Lentibacillus kimchii TaxID=1542911 RepID=A0ABW2UTV5_9BACI